MYANHSIAVVIPAHNESGLVGDVIDAVPDYVDTTYVVDDCSSDGTWSEIRDRAGAVNGEQQVEAIADGGGTVQTQVVAIRRGQNGGRGAAVKTGYRRALDDGMDVIAVVDGDGQMDPTILDRFLDPIVTGEAEYAKGNRLLSAADRAEMSTFRLVGNTVLSYLTKVASGYWRMMDPQNGYTAISARTLESIDLDRLYDDYGFLNDVLVRLNVADARIVDVGMRARYGEESSGISYSTFVPRLSTLLFRRFVWRLTTKYLVLDFHPFVQLYFLGGLGMVGTFGYPLWSLGTGSSWNAGLTFGLLLFSGLLLTLAMVFDRADNEHLETRITEVLEGGVR